MGRLLMRCDRWRERPTFSEHFIFISSRLEGPEQIQFAIKAGLDMAAHSLGNDENLLGADLDKTIEGFEVAAILGVENGRQSGTGDKCLTVASCFYIQSLYSDTVCFMQEPRLREQFRVIRLHYCKGYFYDLSIDQPPLTRLIDSGGEKNFIAQFDRLFRND